MVPDTARRLLNLKRDELVPCLWAAAYFFCLLCAYYILRPLREEMGIHGGIENLVWLFWATMAVMLLATPVFGGLVARLPRRSFIPITYRFFALNLLIFYAALYLLPASGDRALGYVFYVWLSVFNLFAVSVFWALMADLFPLPASKRVFAFIAIGGTLGAIAGSHLTAQLVELTGRPSMFLFSILFLEAAVQCVRGVRITTAHRASWGRIEQAEISPVAPPRDNTVAPPSLASAWRGLTATLVSPYLLGISTYLFLFTFTSTLVYFVQAQIIESAVVGRAARAALFARIDLWVNLLTLAAQLFITGRMMAWLGVGPTLGFLPAVSTLGFLGLGWRPTLPTLVSFQVVRRAANYGVSRPARETLFTVLSPEEKYKAKSFIDTFVYRGGDALGAAAVSMFALDRGASGAPLAVGISAVWLALSFVLAAAQQRRARAIQPQTDGPGGVDVSPADQRKADAPAPDEPTPLAAGAYAGAVRRDPQTDP